MPLHCDISIHALHEESDKDVADTIAKTVQISIHALHEESDVLDGAEFGAFGVISIHALHEESDVQKCCYDVQ